MVTRMFKDLIDRIVEVYIDDMVAKIKESGGHTRDLVEVFDVLRQHKLCLNVEKCSFGVGSGKFLGYMLTTRGIEANLGHITAIQQLHPPNNAKEVQKLIGMVAALNRFISRSVDRCQQFYQLLNKLKGFQWMKECNTVFKDLKSYLASLPVLSQLEPEEDLYMYLVVFNLFVNSVLLRQ